MSDSLTADAPKGVIHDVGYKRYLGTRRSSATRWRVIMRHQISMGWKTWWRFKMWLAGAVIATFITGAVMYISSNSIVKTVGGPASMAMNVLMNTALPISIGWYCRIAFLMSMTISAIVVAGDTQSGAFTFYYARSTRPRDYLLGKVAGLCVLTGILTLAGPFLLACFRLGLEGNLDSIISNLVLIPKVLLIGGLAMIAYAALPLAFSSLVSRRRSALALWLAYYVIGGYMLMMISAVSHAPWIGALDISSAITGLAYDLLDLPTLGGFFQRPDRSVAIASVLIQSAAALLIVWYQISKAEKSGVGGAS